MGAVRNFDPMVPAEGLLYIAAGPPCDYEFMEYRL